MRADEIRAASPPETPWVPPFIAPLGVTGAEVVVALQCNFSLNESHGPVTSATLRTTALGVVESAINGLPTSASVLTPGWTSYEWRLRYAEDDVVALLADDNMVTLRLGPGWYAGRLGWDGERHLYGDRPAVAAELNIGFADGHVQTVTTDETWSWQPTSSTFADLYDGQTIDARITHMAQGRAVQRVTVGTIPAVPYIGPPIERQEELAVVRVFRSPSGRLLVDFGQNLVGWVRLTVQGKPGSEITLRHAEVLEDGELGVRPLRSAESTDRFILSGGHDEFEPTFTFHGFRFIDVEGWPEADETLATQLHAVVVGSRLTRTGSLRTSHQLLNRFHDNVVWSMRGNFFDIPTDCPQRDERLGWTGDIAVFAPTAAYLFDVQDFLTDWMRDLAAETEHAGGVVPYVVPDVLKRHPNAAENPIFGSPTPTAIWGDAAVWVPWALYQHDGDGERLRSMYPTMVTHADTIIRTLSPSGLWDRGFQFGDWLDPAAPADDPSAALTPAALVASASGYRTLSIVAESAAILGEKNKSDLLFDAATRLRDAFRQRYIDRGHVLPETVTGYSLAVVFGLFDHDEFSEAGRRLAELVRSNMYRISTGFAGTPYVTEALTQTGFLNDAYRVMMQTQNPSWLYPVTMGATTIWERWDSMLPDGKINPGEMTSFNHYALGSVADWMHRTIGGIAAAEPGYQRILIAPQPGGDLDWCEAALESPAGPIAVRWEVAANTLSIDVSIPRPGLLRLPGRMDEELPEGRHHREMHWSAAPLGDN